MLKNMKLGGKMALGFGLVVALVVVVGGLSIINMLQISGESTKLDEAYVPEVAIANDIERTSLETMYAMRGYALSFADSYYTQGMGHLEDIKDHLDDALDLSEQFDYLSALKNNAETALTNVEAYETEVANTKETIDEIMGYRDVMDAAAANYLEAAGGYLDSQLEQYQQEVAQGADEEALLRRMRKVFLINDAIDVANNARVLNFKGQATNNPAFFQEAIQNLEAVDAIGEELIALTVLQADKDQIAAIGDARHGYIDAVTSTLNAYNDLNNVAANREKAGAAVLSAARSVAEAGITMTQNMSQAAVDRVTRAIALVIGGLIISVVIAIIIAVFLTMMITRALAKGVTFAQEIAAGDLSVQLDVRQKDEIGILADALREMQQALQYKARVVEQIANGDLTVDVKVASDKDGLGQSLVTMRKNLHELLSQVQVAIEQVTSGSAQVSQSSQELSQGAAEQASSLEEITSSLNEVNSQARQNADSATEANGISKKAADDAVGGNNQMKELLSAMEKINASSDEIQKVVKVIDDIAFQINLLALNANVEAARAGKYGKGFAVVAEEVRNLAVRSAEAVQETSAMVEESNTNINAGTEAAQATATQLESIVEGANKVAELLSEIALASKEQAQGVEQINDGVEQIDQVTQANTASAEESASASEELASQAAQVKGMIDRFKLNNNGAGNGSKISVPPPKKTTVKAPQQARQLVGAAAGSKPGASGQSGTAKASTGNGSNGAEQGEERSNQAEAPTKPEDVIALDDDDFDKF